MNEIHGVKSLRELCPDHWNESRGSFKYRTEIFRYAIGKPADCVDSALIDHIKDNCAAAFRLRSAAINAYENLASGDWTVRVTVPAFLFVFSAVSCVDALLCALHAIITGDIPKSETALTSLGKLKNNKRFNEDYPEICNHLAQLDTKGGWYSKLSEVRNRITHRGYWFCNEYKKGIVITKRKTFFDLMSQSETEEVDLPDMARGLLSDLETWEMGLASDLQLYQAIQPSVSDTAAYVKAEWQQIGEWVGSIEWTASKDTKWPDIRLSEKG